MPAKAKKDLENLVGTQDMFLLGLSGSPPIRSFDRNFDNSPVQKMGQFGRGGLASYYMYDEPDKWALYYTARYHPIGFRLTYVYAADVYANDFGFAFPNQPIGAELNLDRKKEFNGKARKHFQEIGLYDNAWKVCAYDFEQGESLLHIWRQGDGFNMILQQNLPQSPEYQFLANPADVTKDIVKVEPINYVDYEIPTIGALGISEGYKITFFSTLNQSASYTVHPSRCIRWRSQDIDYDQYRGQSVLKSVFAHLQIVANIDAASGQAAFRFGYGLPIILAKGLRKKEDIQNIQNAIGDLSAKRWAVLPAENIESIQSFGLGGSSLDMKALEEMQIQQIASATGHPLPILMGQVAGVVEGSEVNERQYYATLDRAHKSQNRFIRQLISIDPFMQRLLAEYGITDYEIDWGLKQVLTKEQQADLDMRRYNNAMTMTSFATLDEVRMYLDLPPLSTTLDGPTCQFMYGINPQQVGQMILSMGSWKQATTKEILNTPVEREQQAEAKLQTEALTENNANNSAKHTTTQGTENPLHDPGKEMERRAAKNERKTDSLLERICEIPNVDERVNNIIIDFCKMRDEHSLNWLEKETGVDRHHISDLMAFCQSEKIKIKKKEKEKEKDTNESETTTPKEPTGETKES
jgi:hypothetical protein